VEYGGGEGVGVVDAARGEREVCEDGGLGAESSLPFRARVTYKHSTMEDAGEENFPAQEKPMPHSGVGWQILWFFLHLAAVYAIVKFCTPWLAGWTGGTLLPLLQKPTSSGRFEFLFSHIFAFSFIPAFLFGLINARFNHKAAQFVWLVPAAILTYEFATFPAVSVLQSQFRAAYHQYFGSGFLIPEYHSWEEFWSIAGSYDATRGMAQLKFTAPFYAGVGYSLAAWIGLRTELNRKIAEKVRSWEESRFGPHS
jgi:hypothetical protein